MNTSDDSSDDKKPKIEVMPPSKEKPLKYPPPTVTLHKHDHLHQDGSSDYIDAISAMADNHPGFADRIISMAELDQANEHELALAKEDRDLETEKSLVASSVDLRKMGVWMGFTIVAASFALAIYGYTSGDTIAKIMGSIGSITPLVSKFLELAKGSVTSNENKE